MIPLWKAIGTVALLSQPQYTQAIDLNTDDPNSIKAAAKSIAADMMSYYTGNQPGQQPGILPGNGQPGGYYWWVGGGMFGTLVNYWYYTGDDTYNQETIAALVTQADQANGGYFEPPAQDLSLGNDDQAFWGIAAMTAAEYNFPNPPKNQPQYLSMAQGVFNRQFYRWDPTTCGGGIRWQIFLGNEGYDYKNSIANGCFFNLAARLGKYTGNSTYLDAATKFYDWSVSSGLVDPSANYKIVDGIAVETCSDYGHGEQWSYNVGVYLYGAAAMYNATGNVMWQERAQGLLSSANTFLKKDATDGQNVLTEVICEPEGTCQVDQSSFKAYLARWATAAALVCPALAADVRAMLLSSATAAAAVCSNPGGNGGMQCGQKWYTGTFDGKTGIGMQMNAMEVIQTLIDRPGPLDHKTGSSKGDPLAGSSGDGTNDGVIHVTTADKAGASILTLMLAAATLGGGFWIVK